MLKYKKYVFLIIAFIISIGILFSASKITDYLNFNKIKNSPALATTGRVEISLDSVTKTLGFSLSIEDTTKKTFKCDAKRLPTAERNGFFWQNVCEGYNGAYVGIFWKRLDYQKLSFQNGVFNEFMKNRSQKSGQNITGNFICEENKEYPSSEDKTKMRTVVVSCVNKIVNSTTTLYTNFIYSYPVEATVLNASPIIVVSSELNDVTKISTKNIMDNLHKVKKVSNPISLLFNPMHAYASAGAGAAGDGTGAGTGSCGPGSPGSDSGSCGPGGDSGTSGTGDSSGDSSGGENGGNGENGGSDWGSWTDTTSSPVVVAANMCSYSTPTWNGSSCVAPVGNITSNACTIPTNSSSCSMNVAWTVTNPPGAVEVRRPYAGNSVLATGATGNAPYVFPYSATPYTLDLYDAHRNEKLDDGQFSATCAVGGWDSVSGMCVNPLVTSVTVTGQYYSSPGTISFTCSGANNYTVRNTDTNAIVGTGAYSGPRSVSVGPTGNYGVVCGYGAYLSNSTVRYYNAPPPPLPVVSLISSPRTLVRDAQTTLTWDIQWPVNACTFTAESVCTNGSCNAAQLASEAALTTKLRTESTDTSDPSGVRTITSAIRTIAPGRIDLDWKALGRKTVTIANTMDITIDCGSGRAATTRVQVTSSNEQ